MRNIKKLFVPVFALMLAALPASLGVTGAQAQDQAQSSAQSSALARGYRTGYSDGYAAGYQDAAQRAARDFKNKEEYQLANRNYASTHGSIEDYRDGYQQGFEGGYNAGFDHRGFNSTVPDSLSRRGSSSTNPTDPSDDSSGTSSANASIPNSSSPNSSNSNSVGRGTVFIPRNTVMRVELLTNLSTDATQKGDRFQARVIEPAEFEGAMLDGRVTQVKRAGKVKGTAQLQLSFEQIRMPDNRWTNLSAQVIEVIPNQVSEGVGDVDAEGGVRGQGTTRSDVTKVGAATGIGAVIGAIAGGGKGAAIGAAIGAGIGTATVVTDQGKDIYLRQGQELRIRTANEVTIQ